MLKVLTTFAIFLGLSVSVQASVKCSFDLLCSSGNCKNEDYKLSVSATPDVRVWSFEDGEITFEMEPKVGNSLASFLGDAGNAQTFMLTIEIASGYASLSKHSSLLGRLIPVQYYGNCILESE